MVSKTTKTLPANSRLSNETALEVSHTLPASIDAPRNIGVLNNQLPNKRPPSSGISSKSSRKRAS
jgi:hypothetical protein